jgi:hypothetical protein
MPDETRRYSIQIMDVASGDEVLFAAADWTAEDKGIAITQIMRLAGLPETDCLRKCPLVLRA